MPGSDKPGRAEKNRKYDIHGQAPGQGDMYFYQGFEDRGRHIQTAKVEPEDVDIIVNYLLEKYSKK